MPETVEIARPINRRPVDSQAVVTAGRPCAGGSRSLAFHTARSARKFYALKGAGREELAMFWAKWEYLSSRIDKLKEGGR